MIVVRRDADRFLTVSDGKQTRHSFSYGAHYDPDHVGFGPIRAINTERLDPGAGYETHRHRDVEIVTWVVSGSLRHQDSTGGGGVIRPGVAQRLSAGDGAEHSEVNDSDTEPLEFVQMMLASGRIGEPQYASATVPDRTGELLATVDVHAPARLLVCRLTPGETVEVPAAPRSLLHVVRGAVMVDGDELGAGDERRAEAEGPYELRGAGPEGAEVLVWQID